MIDKPSLLDTPNLINWKEFTPSDIPGSSVDDCYGNDSTIRANYDGTDTEEWNTGKQIQETLPAAEWDAFIHDLGAFGWQVTAILNSIYDEIYSVIHGQQTGMAHELLDAIGAGAQTLTNKTISFDNNTLQNVASLNTAQTLTNKTLDLNSDTNKIYVGTANRVLVSDSNKKIVPAAETTDTEIGYVHGVTSNIQTQLNGKQATITGAATTITGSNLTASRALISNDSGKVAASSVTNTELGYLSGVTSNIQTQLDNTPQSNTYSATVTNHFTVSIRCYRKHGCVWIVGQATAFSSLGASWEVAVTIDTKYRPPELVPIYTRTPVDASTGFSCQLTADGKLQLMRSSSATGARCYIYINACFPAWY